MPSAISQISFLIFIFFINQTKGTDKTTWNATSWTSVEFHGIPWTSWDASHCRHLSIHPKCMVDMDRTESRYRIKKHADLIGNGFFLEFQQRQCPCLATSPMVSTIMIIATSIFMYKIGCLTYCSIFLFTTITIGYFLYAIVIFPLEYWKFFVGFSYGIGIIWTGLFWLMAVKRDQLLLSYCLSNVYTNLAVIYAVVNLKIISTMPNYGPVRHIYGMMPGIYAVRIQSLFHAYRMLTLLLIGRIFQKYLKALEFGRSLEICRLYLHWLLTAVFLDMTGSMWNELPLDLLISSQFRNGIIFAYATTACLSTGYVSIRRDPTLPVSKKFLLKIAISVILVVRLIQPYEAFLAPMIIAIVSRNNLQSIWKIIRSIFARPITRSMDGVVVSVHRSSITRPEPIFHGFLACRDDAQNDPMGPEVSLVRVLERSIVDDRTNVLTIWQLSTLSKKQRRLAEFRHSSCIDHPVPWLLFPFHNAEVNFVVCHTLMEPTSTILHVYDEKFVKTASFRLVLPMNHVNQMLRFETMVCQCRMFAQNDGKIRGWRVHLIISYVDDHMATMQCAPVLSKLTYQIFINDQKEEVTVLKLEECITTSIKTYNLFGYSARPMRTSNAFGIQFSSGARIFYFMYDVGRDQFQVYRNRRTFLASDRVLAEYRRRKAALVRGAVNLMPTSMTSSSCLEVRADGAVIRTQLTISPPTLKIVACEAVFEAFGCRIDEGKVKKLCGVIMRY